jgi:hypothetical protein
MMPTDWVDVCIRGSLDTGELLSRLDDPTVQGAWEDGGEIHLYWAEDRWNRERLASVRAALSEQRTFSFCDTRAGSRLERRMGTFGEAASNRSTNDSPQLGTGRARSE